MMKRFCQCFVLGAAVLSLWAVTLLAPAPQALAHAYSATHNVAWSKAQPRPDLAGERIRDTNTGRIFLVGPAG